MPRVFEYTAAKTYRYLGVCRYTGPVFHRPKGSTAETCVGQVKDGVFHPAVLGEENGAG